MSALIVQQHSWDKTWPRWARATWHLDPAQEELGQGSRATVLGESNGPTTLYPAALCKQTLLCIPQRHPHKGTKCLSPPNSNYTAISRSLLSFKSSIAADEGRRGEKKREGMPRETLRKGNTLLVHAWNLHSPTWQVSPYPLNSVHHQT